MAKAIHPQYHKDVKVICISGHEFTVNAAVAGPIKVESCPKCHETYTGKKRENVMIGRRQKFMEKQKRMEALKQAA